MQVSEVVEFHQQSDAAGQQASIRDFVNAGVDAIIVNPADAGALDKAIQEATDEGIVVVSVDQEDYRANRLLHDQQPRGLRLLGRQVAV